MMLDSFASILNEFQQRDLSIRIVDEDALSKQSNDLFWDQDGRGLL